MRFGDEKAHVSRRHKKRLHMQIILYLLYQEKVCLILFLLSHTEIFGGLPKKQNCKVEKNRAKGREYLKGACNTMMKSQRIDDNCSL
jgi:hypothetical protein